MKNTAFIFVIFLFISLLTKISAQEITCSHFCVTNIRMDTQPNVMIISIFFNADEDIFINYPHVSLVTNEEGDTLATGTLNFFGQFGNTEYEYHLDSRIDSIPSDLVASLEFKYDTNICILEYPCIDDPTEEWFPIGAQWYFNQVNFFPPSNSYVHLEVTNNVEISGRTVKEISGACICGSMSGYLYQENEQVYGYIHELDSFSLLYDFSLIAGDTLSIFVGSEGTSTYFIDSVTTYQAGPLNLRVQHIHQLDGIHQIGTRIYERIGANGCLFPVVSFCDPGTAGLRCYEDDITGLLNFTQPEIPCDFVSAVDDPNETRINIYPNPAVDLVHIDSDVQMKSIALIHIPTGIIFSHQMLSKDATSLDIQTVPPGAYLLQILTDHGSMISRKVIITGRQD